MKNTYWEGQRSRYGVVEPIEKDENSIFDLILAFSVQYSKLISNRCEVKNR
jgi:hypothetical protein